MLNQWNKILRYLKKLYLPLVNLQGKIFIFWSVFHSGEMSVMFFLLHAGDLILHMAYIFSERTIFCFASGCFQIESLVLTCKSISCIYNRYSIYHGNRAKMWRLFLCLLCFSERHMCWPWDYSYPLPYYFFFFYLLFLKLNI